MLCLILEKLVKKKFLLQCKLFRPAYQSTEVGWDVYIFDVMFS